LQKKHYLLALIFALVTGMVIAALPQTKAHNDGTSNVYIYIEPHIIPAPASFPGGMYVEVWIDSPDTWDDTTSGIVGYALSVRVDPRYIDVFNAQKGQPQQPTSGGADPGGFLELYLVRNGHNTYGFFGWEINYPTDFYVGDIDATTGTMLDISEIIRGYGTLGLGAGGGPYKLCELLLLAKTADPSVIDLFGPPRPPDIIGNPMYLTVDGTWHEAEVVTDGAYVAETPDAMYFDCSAGYDPATPIGTDWHELWPTFCQWWTLESWDDNGDGVLDESDQIDLVQIVPATGDIIWGHVDWVNPDPVAGDGKADLIITVKPEVPEFPLGLEVIMAFALMAPLIYLWRRKRW
jgi:hypothetical protein